MHRFNKIIVLGAGGTGSALLPFLARYLFSQNYKGRLIIVDGDEYSESNLERQLFATKFIGENKAKYQAGLIASHLPTLADSVEYIDEYLTKDAIEEIINDGTIVINCVDNFAARKYVEDKVVSLNTAAHICCGNELSNGQVQISLRVDGKEITPTIYKAIPKFDSVNDDRAKMSCEELGALPSGGQLVSANLMAGALALNYVIMLFSDNIAYMDQTWIPSDSAWFDTVNNSVKADVRTIDAKQVREWLKTKELADATA